MTFVPTITTPADGSATAVDVNSWGLKASESITITLRVVPTLDRSWVKDGPPSIDIAVIPRPHPRASPVIIIFGCCAAATVCAAVWEYSAVENLRITDRVGG